MTVFINITKVQVYLLLFLTSDEYLFWENKSSSIQVWTLSKFEDQKMMERITETH